MMKAWKDLDAILRGEATRPSRLKGGMLEVRIDRLAMVILILSMLYGACMGSYSLLRTGGPFFLQLAATTLKVPALFFLTLLVTLPSLYVSNALVGSRLSLLAVVRLLMASLGVIVAALASLGPIVAFFSLSTESYPFILLLNVTAFAVAGFLGSAFLLRTLHRLNPSQALPPRTGAEEVEGESHVQEALPSTPGALDTTDDTALSRHVKIIFRCWIILFGLVGAQMGWLLRPFVGAPNSPFTLFRPRESSFFEAIWHAIQGLFS